MAAAAPRPATDAEHDCLPRELAELITGHLSPPALGNLFVSTRSFCQQPTEELVTRLCLDVRLLNLGDEHLVVRLGKLARLRTLQLWDERAHDGDTSGQLCEVVALITTHAPAMRHLTHLDLVDLSDSFLLAAALCLSVSAPPALVTLRIENTTHDPAAGPSGRTLGRLWPSLARIATLRGLDLVLPDGVASAGDLAGLSALTQLRTLRMERMKISLSSLPAMPGLTQLTLDWIRLTDAAAASLVGLSGLQQLDVLARNSRPSAAALAAMSWALLPRLTSLSLASDIGFLGGLPAGMSAHRASFTALVCLTADYAIPTCAQLLGLPSLVELQCLGIQLPVADSGIQLFSVGSISLSLGFTNPVSAAGHSLPARSVAHTFPRLSCLSMCAFLNKRPTALEAWPTGPTGSMLHLRCLSLEWGSLSSALLPLAEAAVAVESLSLTTVQGMFAGPQDTGLLTALKRLGRLLVKVDLKGVSGGVDDQGICTLVNCWPHMHTICIATSSALTSLGLVKLSHASRLCSVTLEGCSEVTAVGVAALAARWSVEHLAVSGCDQVSLADVKGILCMVGRPQLRFVFPGL